MTAHRLSSRCGPAGGLATWLASLLAALLACGEKPQPAAPTPPPDAAVAQPAPARPRGLWVLAEGSQRVLDDPARIPALIATARALGASDLFVQVYRAGRAWFDSRYADATPWRDARTLGAGRDPLAELLAQAEAAGLRVHAWVNVLALAHNAQAPILAALGREAVLVDRRGRSLLDYPDYEVPPPDRSYYRMGTPGLYLDPAAPGVPDYLVATFVELLERYPGLAGLHLDYIRHPDVLPFVPGSRFGVGLDFGYGEATRARFAQETGLEAPLGERIGPAGRWDEWRRDQVTALVRRIGAATRAARPGLTLSAAVWAYADRAYLALDQDWRGWLEQDLLDVAVPMAYTLDDRLLRYQAQSFAGLPYGDRIWIGLGSWLFAQEPDRALAQIASVRAAGCAGESLFSYDSIESAPDLRAALIAGESDAPQ